MALIAEMLGLPPPSALAPLNSPRPVILAPPTESIDSSSTPHTAVSSSPTNVSTTSVARTPSSPSIAHTLASQTLKTSPAANDASAQSEDIELNSIGGNSPTVSTGSLHPLAPSVVHYISKEEQISLVVPSCIASSPVKLIPPLADNAVTTPQEVRESLLLSYRSSSAEPSPEAKKKDDKVTEEPVETLTSSEKVLDEEEMTTGNREEKNEENIVI